MIYFYILMILIIVIFYFLFVLFPPSPKQNSKTQQTFKTGDLIFLCGNTVFDRLSRSFFNCEVSHVGIVVNINDKIFILECDAGQKHKSGVRLIPFQKKQKYYNDVYIHLPIKNEIDNDKLASIIQRYLHVDFDHWMIRWFQSQIFNTRFDETKYMFCSEFISCVLKDFGANIPNPTKVTPSDLLNKVYTSDMYTQKIYRSIKSDIFILK